MYLPTSGFEPSAVFLSAHCFNQKFPAKQQLVSTCSFNLNHDAGGDSVL